MSGPNLVVTAVVRDAPVLLSGVDEHLQLTSPSVVRSSDFRETEVRGLHRRLSTAQENIAVSLKFVQNFFMSRKSFR